MQIADIVKGLKRSRVFVVGDVLLDQYVFGNVHRISPEAPVPVLHVAREEYRLGGAANVAWNLSSLGARVSCCGAVGKDSNGAALKKLLRAAHVKTEHIVTDTQKPTGTKTRIIAHHQQMLRVDKEHATSLNASAERALLLAVRRAVKKTDIIVVSDYQKGTLSKAVCRALIRAGIPTLVGLKGGDVAPYRGATGASLNHAELLALTREKKTERAAHAMLRRLQLQFLIVTLGEKGLLVFPKGEKVICLSTVAREVYDVTGAGDTVLAAFALCVASHVPYVECARIANIAAGIVVGKIGTAVATRQDIIRHIQSEESLHARKVVNERELLRLVKKMREHGKKIVFTNGCFDIVHAGHTKLLQFAKAQGDVLVVGLNSDNSVRRLKGERRPIMEHNERAHVLAALEAVDYITFFDSDTPLSLIKKIRPDVLVKGEDWKGKRVVGRAFTGRVALVPIVAGKSTTSIIERIVARHSK